MDLWAWNTVGKSLFDPVMPHLVFGRGKYDHWLTHETISAGRRQVIDVSETCLTVHAWVLLYSSMGTTLFTENWAQGTSQRHYFSPTESIISLNCSLTFILAYMSDIFRTRRGMLCMQHGSWRIAPRVMVYV